MINPIIIIGAVALILSAFAIAILNKPAVPVVTSAFIIILIFFIITTYLIDSAISNNSVSDSLSGFVNFSLLQNNPNNEDLEFAFNTFKYTDIGLFVVSLISMFVEALLILRQNSGK